MPEFPDRISDWLLALVKSQRAAAHLLVDAEEKIAQCGGALAHYGLAELRPGDAAYEQLRPQLYRAWAYAYAYTNDVQGMRRMLKKLAAQDVRLLGGFLMKRTHPLLQKEAKRALEQSGQVPRKMIVQRR